MPIPGATPWRRGKVRDVYDLGDRLLIVASDRLSAYDSCCRRRSRTRARSSPRCRRSGSRTLARPRAAPPAVDRPRRLPGAVPRPRPSSTAASMLCARAERVDVECVVRGYLTGAGFREYRAHGTLRGIAAAAGARRRRAARSAALHARRPRPSRATTSTIPHGTLASLVGAEAGARARGAQRSRSTPRRARARAPPGSCSPTPSSSSASSTATLTLIDELLTPDSSRYWDRGRVRRRGGWSRSTSSTCATGSTAAAGTTRRPRPRCRPRSWRRRASATSRRWRRIAGPAAVAALP